MAENYLQAREGSVHYLIPSGGYIKLSGADRIDFLHRQSTNDLRNLASGQLVTTVLTSPTARILDVLHVFPTDEHLNVICLAGRGPQTATYLKGKIFFNDKVTVADLSDAYTQIDTIGPASQPALADAGITALPESGGYTQSEIAGATVEILGLPGLTSQVTYRLIVANDAAAAVIEQLNASGISSLSRETYEILRVEAGIPGPDNELTDDYTPLETGLGAAISDSKGCYTGQEIIARQVNYDKITRSLVRLKLAENAPTGAQVSAEGKKVGTVTSSAHSPEQGALALAVVKRPYNTTGTQVQIAGIDGNIQATVEEIA